MGIPFTRTLPLKVYYDTILEDIVNRDNLQPSTELGKQQDNDFEWPTADKNLHPSGVPYLSSLPPDRLLITQAYEAKEIRVIDGSPLFLKDGDISKTVYLAVHDTVPTPRHRHWGLRWVVERSFGIGPGVRCLEIVETRIAVNKQGSAFLVNWGPYSSFSEYARPQYEDGNVYLFPLAHETSLKDRKVLEQIAWNVGSMMPNGDFNCQNWVAAVVGIAAEKGILNWEKVQDVIHAALREDLSSCGGDVLRQYPQ